jgi:ubiquinone/menaquinone biosynthesis C-methylase UbiE
VIARSAPVPLAAPPPEVYAQEYDFWPWGDLLRAVETHVAMSALSGARVVDVMCGPAVLLARIQGQRPDLDLCGCDVNPAYVRFGQARCPGVAIEQCDVMDLQLAGTADVLICTGGLHHVPFGTQGPLLQKLRSLLKRNGCLLLGEEVLSPYDNTGERQLAAIELGAALLTSAVRRGAPEALLAAAIDVLSADLFAKGEYKSDLRRLRTLVEKTFEITECRHVWPTDSSQYGSYLLVCRPLHTDNAM